MSTDKTTENNAPAPLLGLGSSEGLCSTAQAAERLIDPAWIKTSDWPANIIPAGAIAIDQAVARPLEYRVRALFVRFRRWPATGGSNSEK